jgi:hypothetical protein
VGRDALVGADRSALRAGRSCADRGVPLKALLVCYGGAHAATLAPVVAELRARGAVETVALALTTARNTFARWGLESRGYADYLDPRRDADALAIGEQLAAGVQGESVGIPRSESIAYLGLSMRDVIREYGEQQARERFDRLGRHAFLQTGTLGRIVERERPDVVVATNSPKSERAAIIVGNARGLATLIVPDLFADPAGESYAPFQARWYAAMSDITKRNLVSGHGAVPERVVVTGQPAFDKRRVPDRAACRAAVERDLGIPAAQEYALIVTSWNPILRAAIGEAPSSRRSQDAVPLILAALPAGLRAVVKPHPSETAEVYRDAVERHPGAVLAPATADINVLIRGARFVVAAVPTTAVIDALVLDRPTMALAFEPGAHLPFAEWGVPVAHAPHEVDAVVAGMVSGTADDPTPRARLAKQNERAAANVADLVTALAGASPSA